MLRIWNLIYVNLQSRKKFKPARKNLRKQDVSSTVDLALATQSLSWHRELMQKTRYPLFHSALKAVSD